MWLMMEWTDLLKVIASPSDVASFQQSKEIYKISLMLFFPEGMKPVGNKQVNRQKEKKEEKATLTAKECSLLSFSSLHSCQPFACLLLLLDVHVCLIPLLSELS